MRFHILFIALLCCAAVGAGAAGAWESRAAVKGVSVRVIDCDDASQEALFRASMRRVRRTERMRLRFTLLERAPGERFTRARAPGLSRWKRSRRGVRRFAHRQRVRGLADGMEYRMRTDFRWSDAEGRIIRRARSTSRTCSLVGPLPNLRVASIQGSPVAGGERFLVTVANAGRAASPQTGLRLTVDGAGPAFASVPGLDPGASATVSIRDRACSLRVRAVVDPRDLVAESREGDNATVQACP